ncbi:hypothetical protein KI387_017686, partial [Taxus chinensis]
VAGYCLIEETIKYIEKLHHRVEELKTNREQLLVTKSCLDDVNVCVEIFTEVTASSCFPSML